MRQSSRRHTYSANVGALINSGSILLTISGSAAILNFLQESTPDTNHIGTVNYPHYPDPFFLRDTHPEEYPEWTWEHSGKFTKTRPELVTDELRAQAHLLSAKANLLGHITREIGRAREKVNTGILFQQNVYETKRRQAEQFKNAGYDEARLMDYPYIVQSADFFGVSLKQAADDILFKSKLDMEHLLKTEHLRLKYFNEIRKTTHIERIPELMNEFIRESYVYARV